MTLLPRKLYNKKYGKCCHGVWAYDDCAECDKLTQEDKAEKEIIRRDPELREAAKQLRRIGKAIGKRKETETVTQGARSLQSGVGPARTWKKTDWDREMREAAKTAKRKEKS